MSKVNLEVPDKIHSRMKRGKLDKEEYDGKITMVEFYNFIIEIGLKQFEQNEKKEN